MKMLNSNICCTNLDELTEKVGNIIVPTKNKTYKRLKVVESGSEENIEVGKTIYVPINSGHQVEINENVFTIVNAREIILILD